MVTNPCCCRDSNPWPSDLDYYSLSSCFFIEDFISFNDNFQLSILVSISLKQNELSSSGKTCASRSSRTRAGSASRPGLATPPSPGTRASTSTSSTCTPSWPRRRRERLGGASGRATRSPPRSWPCENVRREFRETSTTNILNSGQLKQHPAIV